MEQKLKKLFDYQKFQKNPRLDTMLSEAEARYEGSLSDDDLELVSAAGENYQGNSLNIVGSQHYDYALVEMEKEGP